MTRHIPVLLNEVIEGLNLKPGFSVVDCTLGDGGHSEAILNQIGPAGKLLGIDADPESLLRAKQYLYNFQDQTIFARDNFVNLSKIIAENNFGPADGILLDLGWSTPQFKERGRGFSFDTVSHEAEALDMRYGGNLQSFNHSITAADILNNCSATELEKIFKIYGEEKFAQDIAQAIVEQRLIKPLADTKDLNDVVLSVYRAKLHSDKDVPWIGGIHPATKVFQALRIAVNDELGVLKIVLPQVVSALKSGGIMAIISFHSLEDRVVKQFLQKENNKTLKILTKKPISASEGELANNLSARSAKLRLAQKI